MTPAVISSRQRVQVRYSFPILFFLIPILAVMLSSCSSSVPVSKRTTSSVKKNPPAPVTVMRPLLPEGWADITSRSKLPQIKQWIVNREYSATMVLRELQTDSSTFSDLMKEEIDLVAGISLRGKVPQDDADFRVTRVPTVIDAKRKFSSYAYSERGLLRRVVVFRKQNKYLELELMQEQSGAQFDALTEDLLEFAAMLYDR